MDVIVFVTFHVHSTANGQKKRCQPEIQDSVNTYIIELQIKKQLWHLQAEFVYY